MVTWYKRLIFGIPNLFRNARFDRELEEELDFHLQMEFKENLRRGMSEKEARRQAHIRLGGFNQIKEEHRD